MSNPLLEQLYGMRHQIRHLAQDVDVLIEAITRGEELVEEAPPVEEVVDEEKVKPPTFGSKRHGNKQEIEAHGEA